jgi:tetratricopeptide (TPR) repeat protein
MILFQRTQKLIALLLPLLLVQSCTSVSDATFGQADESSISDSGEPHNQLQQPTNGEQSTDIPTIESPIPQDSILPLLTAEFLIRERAFDEALSILAEQALILEDPGLTRRALRLAEFRRKEELTLPLALRLAEQDPTDAAASATSMALLIRLGRIEEAVVYARQALERGAQINAPALLVSYRDMAPAKKQRLATEIESLAADWPDNSEVGIALAFLHREQGRLAQCLSDLERVLILAPSDDRALVLWTQVKLDVGAKNPFERLEQAVSDYPANEPLRLQYARLLASEKMLQQAEQEFETLIALSPRNGDYFFSLALIHLELKQFADAEQNLESLLALEQRTDEAHYYLGRVAEQRGDQAKAMAAYQQVGPSREFLDAMGRAGRIALELGDEASVTGSFNKARQMSPSQAEALFLLQAELLQGADLVDSATAVLSDGLQSFPASMSLFYARAMAEEQRGNIEAMERDLRAILDMDENNTTTLNALGYTLTVHTTRYAEAAALIEKALSLSPGEPAILDSLGWVYFKLGRENQAIDLLQQAYDKFPDPEVAAHLGEALWSSGREDAALAVWRTSLAKHPGNSHVTDAIERLGAPTDLTDD